MFSLPDKMIAFISVVWQKISWYPCWSRPFLWSQTDQNPIHICDQNHSVNLHTWKYYPEYLSNKPIVSSRSSLNTLLEDCLTIAGLLTPSATVMAIIPFLWSRSTILLASSCTSFAVSLYLFGVSPVPNVLVTWFAHSMTTTILTRCMGTSEKTADHTSCKFACSNLVKGPLHPGNGVLG